MKSDGDSGKTVAPAVVAKQTPLVVRTPNVPVETDYGRYRRYLRVDFYFSCAYCTMSEAEAEAIRFTIDHYEPQEERKDLIAVYSNLMYACDECNTRKGDRSPPKAARDHGYRFFRPDEDVFEEHFAGRDMLLTQKSNVGAYTIDAVDLNRKSLQRLREIRLRLLNCERYVAEGIGALRQFRIDQLPQQIRARAQRSIKEALSVQDEMVESIDSILREAAKSALTDSEPEDQARLAERSARLKHLQGLYPGSWRAGSRKKKSKK